MRLSTSIVRASFESSLLAWAKVFLFSNRFSDNNLTNKSWKAGIGLGFFTSYLFIGQLLSFFWPRPTSEPESLGT